MIVRRVFVSSPRDEWLDRQQVHRPAALIDAAALAGWRG